MRKPIIKKIGYPKFKKTEENDKNHFIALRCVLTPGITAHFSNITLIWKSFIAAGNISITKF